MYELVMPSLNYFGEGCIKKIGEIAKYQSLKKALIVTDENLVKLKLVKPILDSLVDNGIKYYIFDGVKQNPTKKNVIDGREYYIQEKCDFIIGIGGGSPNDCAKAIGLMATNDGELDKYIGFNQSKNRSPVLFMVNTTAGTASEISRAFLISDEEKKEKLIFKDINSLPYAAFNDPTLMIGLPKSITANTGMDALTHAIESYISTGKYGLTQQMSLSSIKLIFDYLEKAINDPENIYYREQMIYAQSLAGMSFCNSGLGLVHSMAHQLGGVYNLPHGLCNAILLPYVMEFNQSVAFNEFGNIAQHIFPIETMDLTVNDSSKYLIDKVFELSNSLGTNIKLRELGVQEKDIDLLVKKTFKDGNLVRNPIQPTEKEVKMIFEKAY